MNSHTKMTGLLGFPLEHSISAAMHNAAYEALRLDYRYEAISVPPAELRAAVDRIRSLGFKGVNVTIPHKVTVMKWLDRLDPSAVDIGAVNTIVNDRGTLVGCNTDGDGYMKSLTEELGLSVSGLSALIIGAGGAARAVTAALARAGVRHIYIVDQHAGQAQRLAEQISSTVAAEAIADGAIGDVAAGVDLLVNASPVGMYPEVSRIPLAPSLLHPGLIVSDVIYNPYETALLREARKIGAKVHHGSGMLVHQGALAFERFTGCPAPVDVMEDVVMKLLQLDMKLTK